MALTKLRCGRGTGHFAIPGWKTRNVHCMAAKQLVGPPTVSLGPQTMSLPMLKVYDKMLNHDGYVLGSSIKSYNKDFLDIVLSRLDFQKKQKGNGTELLKRSPSSKIYCKKGKEAENSSLGVRIERKPGFAWRSLSYTLCPKVTL